MKKFLTEFKEFAVRGNVIDMAVGIVIGGAFSKIVTALVNMVMSVVGLFTSAVNLGDLAVTLQRAGEEAPYFSLPYGAFLQSVLEFIILALCVAAHRKLVLQGAAKLFIAVKPQAMAHSHNRGRRRERALRQQMNGKVGSLLGLFTDKAHHTGFRGAHLCTTLTILAQSYKNTFHTVSHLCAWPLAPHTLLCTAVFWLTCCLCSIKKPKKVRGPGGPSPLSRL